MLIKLLFVFFEEDEILILFYEVFKVYRIEEILFRIYLLSCFDEDFVEWYVFDGNMVNEVEVFVRKLKD